jgi:Acetoacetate decarboxylase (ADC)
MLAEPPIIYRKASAVFAAFPCPMRVLRPLLPHPVLAPVSLGLGKGVCVVAVFDYEDTTIGPYREVGVGFQCRLRRSGPMPLLPLLADRFFEDVGTWVQLLPVTTAAADEAGRAHWGLPKFVADIRVDRTDDRIDCEVIENGERVLHFSADRPGRSAPIGFPLRFYSALGDDVLFTEMHVDASGSASRIGARARLELAEHPRTREFDRGALASARPLEVRWFDEYRSILDRPSIRYRMSA